MKHLFGSRRALQHRAQNLAEKQTLMFSSGSDKPSAFPFVEFDILGVCVKSSRPAELGIKHGILFR